MVLRSRTFTEYAFDEQLQEMLLSMPQMNEARC